MTQELDHGLGADSLAVACERIFKIKALDGHRPTSEKELSQGFIGFKRTQAFYVLAQYPALEAYFVSNQYAVPFGRNAVCGLVPARFFEIVDLYSSDSTKVPVTTESEKQAINQNTNRLSMASIPSPPLSAATANPTRVPLYTVVAAAVDGFHRANNEHSFSIAAFITMANGSSASARMERTYNQIIRFHASLVQLNASEPVPPLPQRPVMNLAVLSNPTLMRNALIDWQIQLQSFLNECIANGFTDNVTVFLIPPNGSVQIIAESALSSRNESDPSSVQSIDSTTNFIQSPDVEDSRRHSTTTTTHQYQQHRPSNPAIPAYNRSSTSTTAQHHPYHSRHDSIYSLLSESQRASLIGNDASQRASYLSEQARQSLISDAQRASIASLSDYQRLSLIESTVSNSRDRDSVVSNMSRHNSVLSKNSNRFSISSRRGSAYVGISTNVESDKQQEDAAAAEAAAAAGSIMSPPPRAPITQFGANGPVRSALELDDEVSHDSSVQQHQENNDYHEEDKSMRRREISDASAKRFGTMLLAAAAEGADGRNEKHASELAEGFSNIHIEGRGRNAMVVKPPANLHHEIPFPARSSSKPIILEGTGSAAVDHNVLKHEVNAINSFFDEDDEEAGEPKLPQQAVRKVVSNVSLVAGRSSSLGWRQS